MTEITITRHDLDRFLKLGASIRNLGFWISREHWNQVERSCHEIDRNITAIVEEFGIPEGELHFDMLSTRINGVDLLSARTANQLMRNGIRTWSDLMETTDREILRGRNQGPKTLKQVNAAKHALLSIGTECIER